MLAIEGQSIAAVSPTLSTATGRLVRLTPRRREAWEPYVGEPIVYAHRR